MADKDYFIYQHITSLSANNQSEAVPSLKINETHEVDANEFFAHVEQEIFKESTICKTPQHTGCQRSALPEEAKGPDIHDPTISAINDSIHESKLSSTAPTRPNSTKPHNDLVSIHKTNDDRVSSTSKPNATVTLTHTTPVHTAPVSHYDDREFKRSVVERDKSSESISTILQKNNDNVRKPLSCDVKIYFCIHY